VLKQQNKINYLHTSMGQASSDATNRARPAAVDASVTTLIIPGLGLPRRIFVLVNGPRLVSTQQNKILSTRFNFPFGFTVDREGNVVVADFLSHALRKVTKEGVVSTLAGNGEVGFADGQGADARFKYPHSVVVTMNGDFLVSDYDNNCIRVVTPEGRVRTLVGNGQAGFADGQGAHARFRCPAGLALDAEGNLLVADRVNSAIRLVTMAGAVSTVAGNGEPGFADGAGTAARFHAPSGIVVDGKGTIIVADQHNHRLRKIVRGQVTTLAGSSDPGTSDGAGARARFTYPVMVGIDERGRLLVAERGRKDTLRVVEASLVPPLWMGLGLPWLLERVLWIGVLKGGKDCLLSRLALDGSRTSAVLLKIIELVTAH
jgi:sugar lactone lactonase YvrE